MEEEEESRSFAGCQETVKAKKSTTKDRIWLEGNKIFVYILFSISVIVTCLSIFKLLSYVPAGPEEDPIDSGEPVPTLHVSFDGGALTIKQIQQILFSLIIVLISSIGISYLAERIKMPGLLGILLLGILFRNVSFLNRNLLIHVAVGSLLRKFAFLVILLRAGLGLDAKALMELKGACVLLAFLPCTFEAFTVAFVAWLIFKINFSFGLLLGFVLAAVSPAVIVPAMLELRTKRLGIDKGIPTLINAAASIDDVYAITWFSLVLSSVTSESEENNTSQIWTIVRAPLEVIVGIILGSILGVILWIFPDPQLSSIKLRRMSLLLSLSFAVLFGTEYLGFETIGPIAVLILGFTAALRWRQLSRLECLKEEKLLKNAWDYLGLPFLFCLIGYQLNLEQLDKGSIAQAVAILICGLAIRCIVAALAVCKTKLNIKEKIFVAISWLPKATVQAALAPVLLDMTRTNPSKFGIYQSEGIIILTVSIIAILITAPTGAILIRLLGPVLLTKSRKPPTDEDPIEMEEKVLNII